MFNSAEQALLFSSVPVGTLLGTLPITPLTSRFGMRKTFVFYGLISSFATLFTPLAVKLDFGFLLIMRVLQGIAVSICFPASGSIIADWSPLRTAGTFIAFLSCHIQFGPILTMPLAGKLCESSWGWPAVYHLQAMRQKSFQSMLTALAFGAFFTFYRDSPRIHRNVSRKELCKIEKGKPPSEAGPVARNGEIPYAAMLRDPAVWAIFFCAMGSTFGFHIFMQYGPVYLNQIIKFDVQRTGFAMALPCILSVLVKLVVGSLSDRASCLSERSRVLLFASLSQFLVAICFCTLALLPQNSPPILFQCFFTTVPVVCGLNCAGLGKSTQLISRQFAHVVTSFSVFACSSIIILIPILVSFLAPDNRPEQWTRIFIIVAVVVVCCVVFFDCTAEASPRPWTFTKKQKISEYKNISINNIEKQKLKEKIGEENNQNEEKKDFK
uniref:Major facilitator superfamily (MFS) profile domain-containing protein n=1 Tax=Meloidogyne incognita TaxID=6306 RepID=A0A914MWX4_MELIC